MINNPSNRPAADATAFTLVELLVVIAIIAVLAALALPALSSARKSSGTAKALSNFRQVAVAASTFSTDNDGQILGWGRYDNWNDDTYLMRNLNLYLNGTNISQMNADAWRRTGKGLAPFVDPLVPNDPKFRNYTEYFPYTWAINRIFNMANGRFYQYGSGSAPWSTQRNPRRMVEFTKPSTTIYALSGGFEINPTDLANEALLNEPVGRQRIFYYHGGGKSTPAIFLDGHVALVPFQIPLASAIPETAL